MNKINILLLNIFITASLFISAATPQHFYYRDDKPRCGIISMLVTFLTEKKPCGISRGELIELATSYLLEIPSDVSEIQSSLPEQATPTSVFVNEEIIEELQKNIGVTPLVTNPAFEANSDNLNTVIPTSAANPSNENKSGNRNESEENDEQELATSVNTQEPQVGDEQQDDAVVPVESTPTAEPVATSEPIVDETPVPPTTAPTQEETEQAVEEEKQQSDTTNQEEQSVELEAKTEETQTVQETPTP